MAYVNRSRYVLRHCWPQGVQAANGKHLGKRRCLRPWTKIHRQRSCRLPALRQNPCTGTPPTAGLSNDTPANLSFCPPLAPGARCRTCCMTWRSSTADAYDAPYAGVASSGASSASSSTAEASAATGSRGAATRRANAVRACCARLVGRLGRAGGGRKGEGQKGDPCGAPYATAEGGKGRDGGNGPVSFWLHDKADCMVMQRRLPLTDMSDSAWTMLPTHASVEFEGRRL